MNFDNVRMLWLAVLLGPLLALFFWATWRKRQALIRQFVRHKTLAELSVGVSSARHIWRRVLQFSAVIFLLLALARPQWGFVWEEAVQRGRDIVIAIDTSRSMLASDLQPTRLVRAKLAALDLLKLGQYDRFGLVAFAGTAFLQCPLTFDEEAFRQSVQILEPGILPQGGTAIGAAIDAARDAFGDEGDDNHKVIVLFTDGEDHEEGVTESVRRAADDAIKIFTIGAGTPAGELLRVRDESGNQVFVKDAAGNVVKSRLNEDLLRQIATTANGFYLPLNAPNAMEVLYQKGLAPMATTERSTKLMKRLSEQFYWPLALAIILLIVDVLIPEQKRKRPVAQAQASSSASSRPAAALTILLALLTVANSHASPSTARNKYNNGEFKGALSEYQELIAKKPDDPRLRYNAGAAAYRANKLDEALSQFQAAASSPDLELQQQSLYNLGNTEFRIGESNSDPKERMASWERAIQHFESALRLKSADQDAAFNRDLVKRKLEELKQQQQQNQQGEPDQDNKDDQQKNEDEQKQDNQNKNQNQQDQKNDQEKQDNQSSEDQQQQNQQKSEQEKQQEQQQQQQASNEREENRPEDSQASKSGGEKENQQSDPQNSEQGQMAQLGKMTPAQARQLLDAQRGEEKALLFIPQEKKSSARERTFKDW